MGLALKCRGAFALRLIVVLALMGYPRISSAAGTWSVISLPHTSGEVLYPSALAVDSAGNLFVVDQDPSAWGGTGGIQQRNARGDWSVIATSDRLTVATPGDAPGQVRFPRALAVDAADNLYVGEGDLWLGVPSRIQKRDAQGTWSLIAADGYDGAHGQVQQRSALAVDAASNLYVADVADDGSSRIQRRDARGNWSLIAAEGALLGQVRSPTGLAVDSAGSLYVADTGNNRVQVYTPGVQ